MEFVSQYPLSSYQEITPLCEKGHVVLVKNEQDENLYVKKRVPCYNPEVYVQLQKKPVPGTPALYGIYEDAAASAEGERTLVIIEEYVPGSTLAERMEERGLFSEKETVQIAMGLCRILMELHSLEPPIIHRDIKPSNVMLLSDGTVKLLDFNAAKAESERRGQDTVLIGTAGFAAPEQYGFSASSPRTDIYAMGVLMQIMLSGRLPGDRIAEGKLNRIIRRCLEVNPKDRYRDVKELYDALKRACKVKVEWLLPGFRTLHPLKMLIALAGYFTLFVFLYGLDETHYETVTKIWLFRAGYTAMAFALIFFYCDYMDLRRHFPFMRSASKWLRLLGFVIAPFCVFWAGILVISILEGLLL